MPGERRRDAGVPRLTQRDRAALGWLEEMRAMSEPDLAVLLGQLSAASSAPPGRARQDEDRLSLSATRAVVRRWEQVGLAAARKVFAHEARYVWLTLEGARLAGAERWTEPSWAQLAHTAAVARARLVLEARGAELGVPVASWTSERRWRQAHYPQIKAGAHVPDAVITHPDGVEAALEVELSDKGPARTLPIVVSLAAAYRHVVYVVPPDSQTARTVRGALREAMGTEARHGARFGTVTVLDQGLEP